MNGQGAASGPGLRIDKWLWSVRFFKTRSIAAEAVQAGHVKINGRRTKAAHNVKVGDALQIVKGRVQFDVRVDGLPARRGPATEAQRCYSETPQSIERRQALADRRGLARSAPTAGRPDKRTRRLLRKKQRGDG